MFRCAKAYVSYWLSHCNYQILDIQLNFDWDLENDKQTMYFAFSIKARHKAVFGDTGKITRKEMLKLFSCDSPLTVVA